MLNNKITFCEMILLIVRVYLIKNVYKIIETKYQLISMN